MADPPPGHWRGPLPAHNNSPCTGGGEHVFWVDGRPQSNCDRCQVHNEEMARFIYALNERSNFLKVPWDEALERYLEKGFDEIEDVKRQASR